MGLGWVFPVIMDLSVGEYVDGGIHGVVECWVGRKRLYKNSNFGPKLDAENSEKIGFGGTEGSQIGV